MSPNVDTGYFARYIFGPARVGPSPLHKCLDWPNNSESGGARQTNEDKEEEGDEEDEDEDEVHGKATVGGEAAQGSSEATNSQVIEITEII